MENSEVTIEGENYEIVDECIGEEDASNAVKKKSAENSTDVEKQDTTVPDNSIHDENAKQNEEVISKDCENKPLPDDSNTKSNIETDTLNTKGHDPPQSNAESVDFTADINLDQLDKAKDTIDESVLNQLDDIENIELHASDFEIQQEKNETVEKDETMEKDETVEKNEIVEKDETVENVETVEKGETVEKDEIMEIDEAVKKDETVEKNISSPEIEEIPVETNTVKNVCVNQQISDNTDKNSKEEAIIKEPKTYDWYEKKLSEKETVIKERLSKVARVLGISYPIYETWLEWEEKVNGSPLCMLKPARRCCLDKPYTNRWKFICAKRKIQDPTKKINDTDVDNTDNKNAELMWKLEASGACGANINNEFEFPPFVLRAVKIFEDFLQTTDQSTLQNFKNENYSDDISMEIEPKNEVNNEGKQDWLWLLVRCNSMDELMLFATGRNIRRSTMDRLKQVFESGPGKDCNVKSLYCKSLNKCNDVTNTTFLVGSEALDEVVGGLKIQLAPKTNFWSNTAGAENIANAVAELLMPTPKTTVLEIGCGIGLIGLIMASQCQQVIGVDSPSEVEEAEMTCELNNIKNASFIMGSPSEVTVKIITAVKNRKTSAIINANTNIGRAIEVMTCLKKIPSLKKIVMITTLTKQSVRAILELARPTDSNQGSPFIPIMARVVDTLPVGPHFEAVILLQRRTINKFNQQNWFQQIFEENKGSDSKSNQEQTNEQSTNGANKKTWIKNDKTQIKKNFNKSIIKFPSKKSKIQIKKTTYTKNIENPGKNTFKGKRSHSPDKGEAPPKKVKKFNRFGIKPWNTDLPAKKKKEWMTENPQFRINPLYDKKMREPKDQPDLRERLSNNRFDTDIVQTVKEHQELLEIAKEKLSGPAPTVDVNTAKQLQSMLNMVLEQTNKLQSQLPRSVWDRIAPPENMNPSQREDKQDDSLLKGRFVQEMGSQDILITAPNKKFLNNEESNTKAIYKNYSNIPPLEPTTVMPVAQPVNHGEEKPYMMSERYETNVRQQQIQEPFNRNRWNEMGSMKKSTSPMRRHGSPIKHRMSPSNKLSPKRPLLSPPRRPCSPPRRHFSPTGRPLSPIYRQRSPMTCQISPLRRPLSPPRRGEMFLNRPMSPMRRQMSPPRRQMSPMRSTMSPSRRQPSPMRRTLSPPRRQVTSPNRMMPAGRQEMLLSRRQTISQERQQTSALRRGGSPQRYLLEKYKISVDCSPSLSRPQSPQRRHVSPQRFTDDWDIPSRGAVEQSTWPRSGERASEQNVWRNEKNLSCNSNWEQAPCNDRQQKSFNQEKWDTNEPVRNDTWNSNGNSWNPKQLPAKPMMKETWSSNFNNRWSNMPGSSNENWNIHGKETFSGYKEPWMDNKKQARWEAKDPWKQCDKEDLNDLPEDAKDPWGDDGGSDLKERWLKFENAPTSSTWTRENEQGDTRQKNKDNWQNKGSSFSAKSQWQNNGVQNMGESRWISQNNMEKKTPSNNTWKSGNNTGTWQFQNSNFQSPRPFSNSQFKSSY